MISSLLLSGSAGLTWAAGLEGSFSLSTSEKRLSPSSLALALLAAVALPLRHALAMARTHLHLLNQAIELAGSGLGQLHLLLIPTILPRSCCLSGGLLKGTRFDCASWSKEMATPMTDEEERNKTVRKREGQRYVLFLLVRVRARGHALSAP